MLTLALTLAPEQPLLKVSHLGLRKVERTTKCRRAVFGLGHGDELLDVVKPLNRGLLEDDGKISLGWLTFPEWMFLSLSDARCGADLRVAIDQRAGRALAPYEDHLMNRIAEADASGASELDRRADSI